MLAKAPLATVLRFGVFELDLEAGELRRAGIRLKLQKQPLQILQVLVQRSGEIVTREELRAQIWPADTFVDFDNSLNTAVNKLRDALADTSSNPRFIETLPRRGYRFIAPVNRIEPEVVPTLPSRKWWRWPIIATTMAVAAIAAWRLIKVYEVPTRSVKNSSIQSLAVLPLRNLSADPQEEYFSDGMTDELITSLAKFPRLRVISHTSVERYKQTKESLPEIGRDLGADAIIEGTILRSGNSIRITAQLIDARSDRHLWAESYERDTRDVLLLQGEIAREIAEQVGVNLTASERRLTSSEREIDPAAHEAYLRGYFYWNTLTCSGFETSLKYFQEAASRAPDFAPAYLGLADAYFNLGDWRCWPVETLSKADAAAQKAIELDPQSADAHDSIGQLAFYRSWDWTKAQKEFAKAIELSPNEAGIHSDYAVFLVAMGNKEQGTSEARKSLELDPISEPTSLTVVYVYYLSHQFDKCIEQAKKTLELFPQSNATYHWLGQCYEKKGMSDAALAAYLHANPGPAEKVAALRAAYQKKRLPGVYATLMELRRKDKKEIDPILSAMHCARLGRNDEAIAQLRQAYQQHCDGLQFLKAEPVYDPLRADPRFQELVSQLQF
jgi:TolB-like protein/DNA-binding winged helix-turn-helix (wHTH) protein/Tfp pilus assembly protein PilF